MFGTSQDYHELNAGAHRNSPKNLYAPALTWHLAFWIDREFGESQSDQPNTDIRIILDEFLLGFCKSLKSDNIDVLLLPCISNRLILFKSLADPESFDRIDLSSSDLNDRERDIFNSGMRCITIKFKWNNLDISVRFEVHTEYYFITTFIELDKSRSGTPYSKLDIMNENIDSMINFLNSDDSTNAGNLNEYFFSGIWRQYYTYLTSIGAISQTPQSALFSNAFADFRGMVFSEDALRFEDEAFFRRRSPPTWGIAAKEKLLRLIKAEGIDRLRKYECTINYLLGGRALYMSTLAPQVPETPPNERISLQFIVYAHHKHSEKNVIVNKWQLGRIINQIHMLGTMRLAALRDITALRIAGQELSQLDTIIQEARDFIATNDEKAMTTMQKAHHQFNGITRRFMEKASCGLSYRIERSRYYVQQFRSNIEMLGILKLEEDQPYDQFVERRLAAQFDFIHRLGLRFERANNNVAALDQNYLSIKAAKIDNEVIAIQKWGEFALLGALVPYYISHLIYFIAKDQYVPYVSGSLWLFCTIFAVMRMFRTSGLIFVIISSIIILLGVGMANNNNIDYIKYFRFGDTGSSQYRP